ncbi:MAG: RecX family transcriptional regulator [Bacteroidetes bacterium]|nr:RecX family transcriptional regulator [Bacteroidota bacterium]
MKRKPKAQLFDDEHRQEVLDLLPVVISGIQVQVNDPSRVSVFADEKFLLGLPIHVSNTLGLAKGTEITETLFWQIESETHRDAIRSWLLGLLAKKPYSRMQLIRKCRQEQYNPEVVNAILDEFESRSWIDDYTYAKSFARDKAEFQKWGPAKIKQHLQKNGIAAGMASEVVKKVTGKEIQSDAIYTLIEKRKLHFLREENDTKRKKKIVDYLLRKGYDSDVVFSNIEAIMDSLTK